MKSKPTVKNELLLENALTLHNEDTGATLRVAVLNMNLLEFSVYEPSSQEYKYINILLSPNQVDALLTLWNEWKDEENAEAN